MGKGKIHEIVAVEKDIKGVVAKILGETEHTFKNKQQLFATHSKLYAPIKDGDLEKPADDETAQPITTVGDKLSYFQTHLIKLFDIILQKEEANSRATENVVVMKDDKPVILAEKIPVSALIQIENLFELVRKQVYEVIPTLDPTKNWTVDSGAGKGKYKSDPIKRQSTKKIQKPLVLHEGNDRHAPQVTLITDDVVVGNWTQVHYSGMISPAEKSELLARLDCVLVGLKKARSRANEVVVEDLHIGRKLFKYINDGEI